MRVPIVFRSDAQAEFDEAFDWYEQQQAGLGLDFLTCVAEVLSRIESFPEAYEVVFESTRRGESALVLQAQSACKISALNEDYTSGMLPSTCSGSEISVSNSV
jgi:monomeric isocitrate dehydrogenase